jgi:hypothetical protein
MRIVTRSALVLAALVAASPSARVASPEQAPFTLGVVRRDGIMIPFATYDGQRWVNTWPEPKADPEIPISLRDVPKQWWGRTGMPVSWNFWSLDGKSRPLKVLAPVQLKVHCVGTVGLRTNYFPMVPAPPPSQHHQPKDGLAVSGPTPIEPIEVLNDRQPEWNNAAQQIQMGVLSAEEGAIGKARGWTSPVSPEQRARTSAKLEVLCRSSGQTPDNPIFYFEAVKQYDKPLNPQWLPASCNMMTFVGGFLRKGADGKPRVNEWVAITDCNARSVDYLLPLGVLRLNGRIIWIVQFSGFGHERYTLLDVTEHAMASLTLLDTYGGGC